MKRDTKVEKQKRIVEVKRVILKKIKGIKGSRFPEGLLREGWEEMEPVTGRRYFIILDNGKIFRTGKILEIEGDTLKTKDSVYKRKES
jgi:hypothetical protein